MHCRRSAAYCCKAGNAMLLPDADRLSIWRCRIASHESDRITMRDSIRCLGERSTLLEARARPRKTLRWRGGLTVFRSAR